MKKKVVAIENNSIKYDSTKYSILSMLETNQRQRDFTYDMVLTKEKGSKSASGVWSVAPTNIRIISLFYINFERY